MYVIHIYLLDIYKHDKTHYLNIYIYYIYTASVRA